MKMKNLVLNVLLGSLVSMLLFSGPMVVAETAPVNTAALAEQAAAAQADPPKARDAKEIEHTGSTPDENCRITKDNAIKECLNPTGQGFKKAGALLTTLPAIATAFMSGGDPGKMAEMCQLTQVMGLVGGLLNGGQGQTCQQASAACQSSCGKAYTHFRNVESQAAGAGDSGLARQAQMKQEDMKSIDEDCQKQVQAQMQLAQQQQQAGQQPMAGAEACQAALDSDQEDEIVDCTQPQFANAPECTTVGKTDAGGGITFEPGAGIAANDDETDLPAGEDREDYWNSLKGKTGGGAAGSGSGTGALGGSGNSGGFGSAAQKAGGAGKKSGSSLMTGGSDSSAGGGGGWGNMAGDDFDKKYSKLSDKKKGLGMLTKKKIGGRNIAAAEFGSSSDDIWTRVYLRTNTRCTKQLTECAANKSLNPYGVNKAR